MNDRDLDYLESQNDDEISGLSAKVNILKNVRCDLVRQACGVDINR